MHVRNNSPLCCLFGGTFDPIHYGHLAPVWEALQAADAQQVAYLPAAIPPHRPPPCAAAEHRLAMVRIALAEQSLLPNEAFVRHGKSCGASVLKSGAYTVDDIELMRAGPSYTIDTVQALQQRHPQRRYALLVGLDALLGLESWHRWQDLQQCVHIIVIARRGWQLPQSLPSWWHGARVETSAELHRAAAGKIFFINATPVAVSSTLVRARLKAGEQVRELLPAGVYDYIHTHHLYGK